MILRQLEQQGYMCCELFREIVIGAVNTNELEECRKTRTKMIFPFIQQFSSLCKTPLSSTIYSCDTVGHVFITLYHVPDSNHLCIFSSNLIKICYSDTLSSVDSPTKKDNPDFLLQCHVNLIVLLYFSHSALPDSLWLHGLQHAKSPFFDHLTEIAQSHVHRISDAIQLSHSLLPLLQLNFSCSVGSNILQPD